MKINVTFEGVTPQELSDILVTLGNVEITKVVKATEISQLLEEEEEANGASVDKNGLPWDERIHSSNRKFTAKGEWSRRRNVGDEIITQVEAELRVKHPAPVAVPPAPVQFGPGATNLSDIPAQFAQPLLAASIMPPAPVAALPIPVVTQPPAQTFEVLCGIISAQMGSGIIDGNYIPSLMQRINAGFSSTAGSLTDIMGNQQMIDYAFACMRVDGKIA